jgi:hypothetical protein
MASRRASLAVLAGLIFLPTSSQAQNNHRPISDAQFKKIVADAQVNGKVREASSVVTTAFGITRKGETLTLRQSAFADDEKNYHTIVLLPNGQYLFSLKKPQDVVIYYVDANLALIAALNNAAQNGISILPNKNAQSGLDAELKFFAGIADEL